MQYKKLKEGQIDKVIRWAILL